MALAAGGGVNGKKETLSSLVTPKIRVKPTLNGSALSPVVGNGQGQRGAASDVAHGQEKSNG